MYAWQTVVGTSHVALGSANITAPQILEALRTYSNRIQLDWQSNMMDNCHRQERSAPKIARINHFGAEYSIEYKITSVESNSLSDKTFEVPRSVAEIRDKNAK